MTKASIITSKKASAGEKEAYIARCAKHFKALAPKYQKEIKDYLQNNPKIREKFPSIVY